jgi:hypothetical protein
MLPLSSGLGAELVWRDAWRPSDFRGAAINDTSAGGAAGELQRTKREAGLTPAAALTQQEQERLKMTDDWNESVA